MPKEEMPVSPRVGPQPGRWVLSHADIRTVVLGLMLAMFLAALNQTIVATALPTIGRDFRDFELLPWVVGGARHSLAQFPPGCPCSSTARLQGV